MPELSETYESNVPGLYIVGALGGYPLIKQAMNQGYEVVITSKFGWNIDQETGQRRPGLNSRPRFGARTIRSTSSTRKRRGTVVRAGALGRLEDDRPGVPRWP